MKYASMNIQISRETCIQLKRPLIYPNSSKQITYIIIFNVFLALFSGLLYFETVEIFTFQDAFQFARFNREVFRIRNRDGKRMMFCYLELYNSLLQIEYIILPGASSLWCECQSDICNSILVLLSLEWYVLRNS